MNTMNTQKEPLLKGNALKKCLFWEFCVPKGHSHGWHCHGMNVSGNNIKDLYGQATWWDTKVPHTEKEQNPN